MEPYLGHVAVRRPAAGVHSPIGDTGVFQHVLYAYRLIPAAFKGFLYSVVLGCEVAAINGMYLL